MAHLRFAGTKLSVELCDGSCFHTTYRLPCSSSNTSQNSIQLLTSCRNVYNIFTQLVVFSSLQSKSIHHTYSGKTHRNQLAGSCLQLLGVHFTDSFYLHELLHGLKSNLVKTLL